MTSIKIDVQGLSDLLSQLQDLGAASDDIIEETLIDLARDTQQYATDGINLGPKTGRVYTTRFWTDSQNRLRIGSERVPHQASAPGEYPASDEGRLAGNIRTENPSSGSMTARVGTKIEYGRHLEFGTVNMAARPWLLPSFEKAKVGVEKELKAKLESRI